MSLFKKLAFVTAISATAIVPATAAGALLAPRFRVVQKLALEAPRFRAIRLLPHTAPAPVVHGFHGSVKPA